MKYRFKPLEELYWGVVTAASIVLLQALFTLQPEAVSDWQTWAVALGGATVRAAAGAALDWLRRSAVDQDDPLPTAAELPPLSDADIERLAHRVTGLMAGREDAP